MDNKLIMFEEELKEYLKGCKEFSDHDAGPWELITTSDGKFCLFSDDFRHDVSLSISGDFYGDEDKKPYMEKLCYFLNNAKLNVQNETIPTGGKKGKL